MQIHIRGTAGAVADWVLLPGDPERAEQVAWSFLEEVVCYTTYRKLYGFTGVRDGQRISVQATGMGAPSAAIVCEELSRLGAKGFVRIGTCGALSPAVSLGDTIVATAACPFDGVSRGLFAGGGFVPTADFFLVRRAVSYCEELGIPFHCGPVGTMDLFYDPRQELVERLRAFGVLALEMEASAILTVAAQRGLRAACVLAVSDLIAEQKRADEALLQRAIHRMIPVALHAVSV